MSHISSKISRHNRTTGARGTSRLADCWYLRISLHMLFHVCMCAVVRYNRSYSHRWANVMMCSTTAWETQSSRTAMLPRLVSLSVSCAACKLTSSSLPFVRSPERAPLKGLQEEFSVASKHALCDPSTHPTFSPHEHGVVA
jgi:hypothetical protein